MPDYLTAEVRQGVPLIGADGFPGRVRLNRRNEIVTSEFVWQSCIDGRLFAANSGTITTPITWTSSATIGTGTTPMIAVTVPTGTTAIPVYFMVYQEVFGTTAQTEYMGACGIGGVWAGTALTPTNMRADAPNTSTCTVKGNCTGTTYFTPLTSCSEFWRDGQQFAITKTSASATASTYDPCKFVWKLMDGFSAPVCVGPSSFAFFQGSQAGQGFAQVFWVEYPTVMVT